MLVTTSSYSMICWLYVRHLNSANMAATALFEHIRPDLSQLDTALTAAIGERISVLAFKEAAAILQTLIKQHEVIYV